MKRFMDDDFLLHSEVARRLYHDVAAQMPIYDYHCHLNPQEIAEDRQFANLGQIWLEGDHYKWRALRAARESLITGNTTSDYDKYLAGADRAENARQSALSLDASGAAPAVRYH